MEKEFIGGFKDWKKVYEKTKELYKEKKIESICFVLNENFEKYNKDICGSIIMDDKNLEQEFYYNSHDFFASEKFELFILTDNFGSEFCYALLAVVYYVYYK